jgi:PKD repeat protein
VVVGNVRGFDTPAWAAQITADGSTEWSVTVNRSVAYNVTAYAGLSTADEGVAIAGTTDGPLEGDMWVYKAEKNEAPNASFAVSQTEPTVGKTVTFDAAGSSDPDDQLTSYKWSVDGSALAFESGEQAQYVFDSAGNHTVELTVTDEHGARDTATIILAVT